MINIEKDILIIVEGEDEKPFFEEIIKFIDLGNVQVLSIGGKTKLKNNLRALVRAPGFLKVRSIGIVRDANGDHKAAFQSVCGALKNADLLAPNGPLTSIGENPKITVFILPGLNLPGMLEDLCLMAVGDDCAMPCIDDFIDCLSDKNCDTPSNLSKAKLQIFLASRKKPGLRLGEAAQAGHWPWENKAFDQVKQFLAQVVS